MAVKLFNPIKRRNKKVGSIVVPDALFDDYINCGYVRLSDNPEVQSAIFKIADMVSSTTIHLKKNTSKGDIRIKNALSRMIDITPNKYLTRKAWMTVIVNTLLFYGNSIVVPVYNSQGLIENLVPVDERTVSYIPNGDGYYLIINGVRYEPEEVIHFTLNPKQPYYWKGTGYESILKPLIENLAQAQATKNGFMKSKWKPSLIIRVDSDSDELSTPDGRDGVLKQYVENNEAGKPWILPAEMFDVKEVKPLSLNDLAINEAVTLDKKTVAALLGVPEFVVGVGSFNKEEWNNFINTRIKPLCAIIEQELTRKLLVASDLYFKFNPRSLYSYDIETLSTVGENLYTRGLMLGNELRDWIDLDPLEGLDELVILENYIPQGMIGDQKKLKSKGGEADG